MKAGKMGFGRGRKLEGRHLQVSGSRNREAPVRGARKIDAPSSDARKACARSRGSISFRALRLLGALAALAAISACGVKTHPWPEMVTLPSQVLDLAQTLDSEGTLWLSWKAPLANVAGRPLKTLDHFEVWGADYDLDSYCQGCPSNPVKIDEVYLEAPAPGREIAEGPYVWQTKVRSGRVYVFKVAGFSSRGAVNPGAWAQTVVWSLPSPGPLSGFSAAADDLSVYFSRPDPSGDLVVEVQKRRGSGPWETLDPERDAKVDTSVSYGETYSYRARLLRVREGTKIPGPWTAETALLIEDALPPPPPGYLDAAVSMEGVRLVWESLADRGDVAGYKVYRADLEGGGFRPLGGLISTNAFVDRTTSSGGTYRYRVTAVDDSPRANESAPSPETEVLSESPEEAGEAAVPRPELPDPGI